MTTIVTLPQNWRPGATLSAKKRAELTAALDQVQGRARCRLLNVDQTLNLTRRAYTYIRDRLQITRAAATGTSVVLCLDTAHDFPRAYKYRPESTILTIRFDEKRISIEPVRDYVPENGMQISLSRGARECMVEHLTTVKAI